MITETKNIIINIINEEDDEGWYMLKGCEITSFSITRESGTGHVNISTELRAEDYVPAEFNCKFKDKKCKVLYKDYYKIKKLYGNPEDMSYREFEDRLLALKI